MLQSIKNIYHLFQAYIANVKYGFPARKLKIIGVTGTDGKTTCTSMIYHTLKESGKNVAMISTLYAIVDDEKIDTGLHVTTPEPWDLPRILKKALNKNVEYVVLESTSQGLEQNRLFSVEYDSVLITNIGHDHIDYHRTWENYAGAKLKIVEKTRQGGLVVLNSDHESSNWLKRKVLKAGHSKKIEWFSVDEFSKTESTIQGIKFVVDHSSFEIPIIGAYNSSNALGVIKICRRYLNDEQIASALKTFEAPTGRMQIMQRKPFGVIIDFAHTPSSLEAALSSIDEIRYDAKTKVICVFGCAGERDEERRKMGAVSSKLADITIIALEDPRTEKVFDINTDIISHAEQHGGKLAKRFATHNDFTQSHDNIVRGVKKGQVFSFDYDDVQNRIDAIDFAFKLANKNDIVFITGKGHEESLAIGNPIVEYPYSDQETVDHLLKS
jgi:UDP-N-acetylmuramoyl-L-alanyl-D-glutamate--2,6-diaminopimelate ligase